MKNKVKLDCDQIADLLRVLDDCADFEKNFRHRTEEFRNVAQMGFLLEILNIINAEFEDTRAAGNAIHRLTRFNELRFGEE